MVVVVDLVEPVGQRADTYTTQVSVLAAAMAESMVGPLGLAIHRYRLAAEVLCVLFGPAQLGNSQVLA
jgi:hypothetical protein